MVTNHWRASVGTLVVPDFFLLVDSPHVAVSGSTNADDLGLTRLFFPTVAIPGVHIVISVVTHHRLVIDGTDGNKSPFNLLPTARESSTTAVDMILRVATPYIAVAIDRDGHGLAICLSPLRT